MLETKLHQLMDSLIRNEMKETLFLEVSKVDGRWCMKSGTHQLTGVKGLLLSSNSGTGNIVEPLSAVPLNDELQRARASVAQAEADVLMMLTEEMQKDLDDIRNILETVIQLDTINARATYSLSFGGAYPNLYLPEDINGSPFKKEWILYMPKAHHPLLLQQHRENLRDLRKEGKNTAIISAQELGKPVPFDFFIAQTTKVLVITGPNTGGKTICLKTVGLAAMMAKSGLHVLSSESVQIPWFDSIFADIGDEQSLSQSLSTFSGHLKNVMDIRSQSTNQSLVLLDEVGAGTNPLEGAALGMSLLESFADSGALLTIATTHYGELKSLKYSNNAFENACMEFDEVNLNPTYKIIWGVPGRSNAINISEKLGLPSTVVSHAREFYGADSAEINEVICAMEKFKQMFQESLYQTQHHLLFSRNLYEKLLLARRKVMEHGTVQRYRKMKEIAEAAAMARSALHKKVLQLRTYKTQSSRPTRANEKPLLNSESKQSTEKTSPHLTASRNSSGIDIGKPSVSVLKKDKLPEVGDRVHVSTLRREATVLRVDPAKEEIVVQAGNMKLKLKFTDINA
uniref:DNA mismatch repair proteins mutS family domain-containing protein n=3 Tax=Rhizophora mucronata TaxID=61149 RepID=A0A2P2MPW6_RHIMU